MSIFFKSYLFYTFYIILTFGSRTCHFFHMLLICVAIYSWIIYATYIGAPIYQDLNVPDVLLGKSPCMFDMQNYGGVKNRICLYRFLSCIFRPLWGARWSAGLYSESCTRNKPAVHKIIIKWTKVWSKFRILKYS